MKQVDMSEAAILRRFKRTSELRELCLFLMKAKTVSPERLKEIQESRAKLKGMHKPEEETTRQ